jgi:hypothetical protein
MAQPLKYYAEGKEVLLSHAEPEKMPKYICTAVSNRLAQKIASNMNLMESRAQKAHEIYLK